MRTSRLTLLAAFAGLLVACKGARPVATPAEAPRTTNFPHEKHGGFDCVDCHTGIPKATRLGQAALPGLAKCKECHEVDTMSPADKAAHTPLVREPREHSITFDHAGHLARIQAKELNDACRTCHKEGQLPDPGPARSWTPAMQACTTCHYHQVEVAEARCQPCHVSLKRFPLKPIEALAGFSHQGNFVREHGNIVKNSAATCAQCHDQTYCANCHANATVPFRTEIQFPENVQANFIHRGDYVSRHQIEANADPASCRKCHGSYFCDSCHAAQNISPRNTLAGGNPHNPHPLGWATPGSGDFHGTAARQNIVACAGCHDQGKSANCVNCHRSFGVGRAGIGGNPHPAGWSGRHSRDDIHKNGMCVICHTNG
jgi:hypothetical protein